MNKNKSLEQAAKIREFWIIDETPFSTWVSDKPLNSGDTKEEIHVIEYRAYEQLKAENADLKRKNKSLNETHETFLAHSCRKTVATLDKNEVTKLKADLSVAIELIEQIRFGLQNRYDSHHLNAYCMADDYLSKLKNEGV